MGCDISNLDDQNAQHRNRPITVYPENDLQYHNHPQNSYQNAYQNNPVPNNQQGMHQQYQTQGYPPPQYQSAPNNQQYVPQLSANHGEMPKSLAQNDNSQIINNTQQQKVKLNSKTNNKHDMKISNKRGIMPLYVNKKDNFLTHHLKSEMHLSKHARADLIRRRQVLEHNTYESILNRGYGTNIETINEYAMKSYFQRIMLEIFQTAHKQFFDEGKSYDEIRQKVAQRYLFEMYQNKEFLDAGVGKYESFIIKTQLSMNETAVLSDSSLFPVLRFLKENYPQVADKTQIEFPEVKEKKQDINLLDNFPSKCYTSPKLINVQTLYSDLKFLIDRSLEEFNDFQSDMKTIMGEDVLTDSKVKRVTKNGVEEYTASPVRRVFIKWVQTIIERIPSIIFSESFVEFIGSKSIIADNFCFRSTVQPTSHGKVIDFLCKLLQTAKYDITTMAIKKEFGFFIYDLLRCKTKRNTGKEVCELLKKMQGIKVTPSGKRFEVVRIKNRFKTPNRDLMVNFRYGDVIVGQAQLCIDTSDVSQKTKKTNKFNHYIYELQRGLFGPTCELMMQYEDFQRTDIRANLQAEGKVNKRTSKKPISYLKKTMRKCFNSHDMIELVGNLFMENQSGTYDQKQFYCDYCQRHYKSSEPYYYCYFCTIKFCHKCDQKYKKEDLKEIQLRCNRQDVIPVVNNDQQLKKVMGQCSIVIFYLSREPSSVIYKDAIVYLMAVYKMQKKQLPSIYAFCCDTNTNVESRYNIQEFPTTILFGQDGTPQTTLIGASWTSIEGFFQSQIKLSQHQQKQLEVPCWCQQPYRSFENEEDEEIFCLNCGNANQSEGFQNNLVGQDNSRIFKCSTGHCRCLNCGFLADFEPSTYKDHRGKSYMYEKKVQAKLPKCLSGHQTVHIQQINQTKQIKCFKCQQFFVFNNVLGAGFCKECKIYCCSKCIGIDEYNLKQVEGQLVNHTAQETAEQGEKCVCNRLFKKVYNTRDYTYNFLENKASNEDKTQELLRYVYETKKRTWTCLICDRTKADGELHLACFSCPKMVEINGQRLNIEICIQCSIGTELLNKQLEQKTTEVTTDFVCKSKHPVVKTRLAYNDELTFDCIGCRASYYIYSQRYYCKLCKTNVCLNCFNKHLINTNPPKCLRECNSNHNLKLKQNPDLLTTCDGCKILIKKAHFTCPQECGFDLCLNCAATPPGIDTTSNRMKHVDQEALKKKMEQYERGWVDDDDNDNDEDDADDYNDELNEDNDNSDQDVEDAEQVESQLENGSQQQQEWWDQS